MKRLLMFWRTTFCVALLLVVGNSPLAHAHLIHPSSSHKALDIGKVGHAGANIEVGDTYRVWGSGSDIGGKSDQFYYVSNSLPANGQMVAQVQSQENTNGWAKAGIMLRETLAGNATNVFLNITPLHGVTFQWRGVTNALTHYLYGPQGKPPTWLKLVRHQNTITGFVSDNGTTWNRVGAIVVPMGASSSIGLAVTAHNNTTRSRVVFAHVAFINGSAPAATIATRVYGQAGSFTSGTANNGGISANSLSYPSGVAIDRDGNLYVSDCFNNRVLYYPAGSTTSTRVYGQGDSFTSGDINHGGISADSLRCPWAVVLDSNSNLYVEDDSNNRVLYYPAGSTTATRVYGQGGSFSSRTANNGGASANSLNDPEGMAIDSHDNLYVADSTNNRVLYYPAGSISATRVYGQGGSFSSTTANNGGISTTSLSYPSGIALDGSDNLYVTDALNNRVLYYPAGSTSATRVYGQGGSFSSGVANNGGISANSFYHPLAAVLDGSDNLYIEDDSNNRVLYYPAGHTTATRVYGQGGSFSSGTANNGGISTSSFNDPEGITIDSHDNLYVADSHNNRILMFPST